MSAAALNHAPVVATRSLLDGFSFEIMARDASRLEALRPVLPHGTMVSITWLPTEDAPARIEAARAVRKAGFVPMPHVAARHVASADDLRRFVDRLVGEAGVDRLFVVAGDVASSAGPYADTLALIEAARLGDHGIGTVGIGGYPDGHPGIAAQALDDAMQDKLAALAAQGVAAEILTQFAFDAAAVVSWVRALRRRGIGVPIRLGLPGPTQVGTLLRYARRCGVGTSARVMARYGASVTRLLSMAGPDRLYRDLAASLAPSSDGPVAIHLFPFGGLEQMADWTRNRVIG